MANDLLAIPASTAAAERKCREIGPEARKTIDKLAGIKNKPDEQSNKIAKPPRQQFSLPTIAGYFDQISDKEQTDYDFLLTRGFYYGNIDAHFLDDPFLKGLLNKMRPSYKIPSRNYTYPKILVPAEYERVMNNLERTT